MKNIKHVLFGSLLILTIVWLSFSPTWQPNTKSGCEVALPAQTKLTINPIDQKIVKASLQKGLSGSSAKDGSVILLDANTGAIRAMSAIDASQTCSTGQLSSVALGAWEPGSVMKPLLVAAALDKGTISANSTYFDPGSVVVQGRLFTNDFNYAPQTRTIQDILTLSLNTGAIHVLKSLGQGTINTQARQTWYDYLAQHYRFNQRNDSIRPPTGGQQLETQYAAMSFGVEVTVTPLQLAAAYAALVNGGTFYQPHLVNSAASKILEKHSISSNTSRIIDSMLENALKVNNPAALRTGYIAGAKSGTAPAVGPDQAYSVDGNNGAYIGFLGKTKPDYILLVRLDQPDTQGLASGVARLTWTDISNQLVSQGLID